MRIISVVIDHMNDTLNEAEEYYHDYILFKDESSKLANTSLEMAKTHLTLYMKWHDVVVELIEEYKNKKGEAPQTMRDVWNYKHMELTDFYKELKYKIDNI